MTVPQGAVGTLGGTVLTIQSTHPYASAALRRPSLTRTRPWPASAPDLRENRAY